MNYKNKLALSSFFFLILFVVSCTSTKEPQTTLPSDIDPNNSRISGTIISIEELRESTGPCSKQPCIATVTVNNVIGYGSSFTTPIVKDNNIKLKFEFTLAETSEELFPNLETPFPGLKVGDKFIGDIEKVELIQLDTKSTKIEYRIFNYDKID